MPPSLVFVLGPPGAGKGTQCQRIAEHYGYHHISAGDLLRQEQNRPECIHAELIRDYLRNGRLVPIDLMCDLLKSKMNAVNKNEQTNRFLIDGFPRSTSNREGWKAYGFNNDVLPLSFVLYFDCPLKECENRCLRRASDGDGRSDDNIESIRRRFETYSNETMPVLEYYENQGLLRRVDANKSQDEVFEDVKRIFSDNGILSIVV